LGIELKVDKGKQQNPESDNKVDKAEEVLI